MATRARIAVKVSEDTKVGNREVKAGEIIHVYSHWDGYPSEKMPMLTKNYNTEAKAVELISLGNISSLEASCEKPEGHSFDNRIEGYSTFYERDRGETQEGFEIGNWKKARIQESFGYLFENGKWTWISESYRVVTDIEKDEDSNTF